MLPSLVNWQKHFEDNVSSNNSIDWGIDDSLTPVEIQTIKKSIAAFQLGESSEGKNLFQAARSFATKHNNPYLVNITRLFIKEEQGHSLLLKHFMEKHKIPTLKKNWSDNIFRKLRKIAGFELSVTILITAELLSLVFYSALFNSTNSKLLKEICRKLLKDEITHVKYESSLLIHIREQKPWLIKYSTYFAHQFFYFGTMLVVYLSHHKVINLGGYTFAMFWQSCWQEFSSCFGQGHLLKRIPKRTVSPIIN